MKIKQPLLSFINQIIPVMIGVYLGFALNNFGEAQKVRKQFKVYKNLLSTEVVDNISELDSVQQYHVDMRDGMQRLLRSSEIVQDFDQFRKRTFRGIRPGLVNKSAYETGIQTGMIQEFPLATVQLINKTYTMQKVYTGFTENLIQSLSTQRLPETEEEIRSTLRIMIMSFNDIQSMESQLMTNYGDLRIMIDD